MDKEKMKSHLPTVARYLEKRKLKKAQRLPKHLRPRSLAPLAFQILLNVGIIVTLFNLMSDRDDFMTEAGPAVILVVCLLLLIITLISAMRLRQIHLKVRGHRWAQLNVVLMALGFLLWAVSIVVFLS